MRKIILASQSPRRRELLENIGIEFEVKIDSSPEIVDETLDISEIVKSLSAKKAENVSKIMDDEDCIVIAADTVVAFDDKILGKPESEEDAANTLKMLSGNIHFVYTGISVLDNKTGKIISDFEKTKVRFRELSDTEIRGYVKSGEPMDKAGSYGIQGLGSMFVEKICGDYFNIVGLPICKLCGILKEEFKIDISR